jgi:tetratricopeptide (TPR) repeat protein
MNVLRRLIKQPVLFMWVLAAIAILLNYADVAIYGAHGRHHEAKEHEAKAAHEMKEQHNAQVHAIDRAGAGLGQANTAAAPVAVAEIAQNHNPTVTAQQAAPAAPTAEDLLRAAREAYWSNEYDRAIEFYQALIQQEPNNLAAQGELANVYWWQGNTQKASELFSQLAPKLAAQGRQQEALNMRLYVEMVNPALAKSMNLGQ